ncbi:LOW QUALITY PROTEIN: Hypothetical protein PHPALM_14351 [Phytophthora palmivora]|uniref:Uncharacterized protein n=1 Tax=Phytophthora palmivora TaxID=4796 RepID=A0A2P4XV75_9STRA|nr:LOW QUALITY PROTEIN: Hypothetical protein PHPALM_14351 [Phytophthora palmivora]
MEGEFDQCYRMNGASFDKLLALGRPVLLRDEIQSERRTGTDTINPENTADDYFMRVAAFTPHTPLADVSRSTIYDVIVAVMDALRDSEDLRIHSPTESSSRIEKPATGVMKIIPDDILVSCVVCLDAWVCPNRVPSWEEVPDDATFISGTIR